VGKTIGLMGVLPSRKNEIQIELNVIMLPNMSQITKCAATTVRFRWSVRVLRTCIIIGNNSRVLLFTAGLGYVCKLFSHLGKG